MHATTPVQAFRLTPFAVLGTLYRWFHRRAGHPSFQPIKDIAARHCFETLPVATSSVLFGVVAPPRKYHSLSSAQAAFSMNRTKVLAIAKSLGVLSERGVAPFPELMIDADAAAKGFPTVADFLSPPQVQELLQVTQMLFRKLQVIGFLTPVMTSETMRYQTYYSKPLLEKAMEEYLPAATSVEERSPETLSLIGAARNLKTSVPVILQLTKAGRLTGIERLRGDLSLKSVFLDADQVTAFGQKVLSKTEALPTEPVLPPSKRTVRLEVEEALEFAEADCLRLRQVVYRLKITERTILGLTQADILRARKFPARGGFLYLYHKDDIEHFEQTYVSPGFVGRHLGRSSLSAYHAMNNRMLQPALPKKLYGTHLYRRQDVEKAGLL